MIVSLLLSLARGRKRRRATPAYLTVSPISHDFGMNTGSVEIVVDSSSAWTASGVPSDMALSATSGSAGTATIYLTRTSISLGGTATITFTNSDGETATFAVTRTATYLTLSQGSAAFGGTTTSVNFTVESSSAWTASGVAEGFSLSATAGAAGTTTLTLTRTDFTTGGSFTITFTNEDGKEATLSVSYEWASITLSTSSITVSQGSSASFTVTSGSAWSITSQSASVSGFTISPSSGDAGTTTVTITTSSSVPSWTILAFGFENEVGNMAALVVNILS